MFISHVESMEAVKSSVYTAAAAIDIFWISSAGPFWTFRARAIHEQYHIRPQKFQNDISLSTSKSALIFAMLYSFS